MEKNVFQKLKEVIGGIYGIQAGMEFARAKFGLSWNQVEAFCDTVGVTGTNLWKKYLSWRGPTHQTFADFVKVVLSETEYPIT